jgi:DNA recombination protein RmuC
MEYLLAAIGGLTLGAAFAWLVMRAKLAAGIAAAQTAGSAKINAALVDLATERERANRVSGLETDLAAKSVEWTRSESMKASFQEKAERIPELEARIRVEGLLAEANREITVLSENLATAREQLSNEERAGAEKLAVLLGAQDKLTDQFKNLANDILEDKSRRFTEQNQANLGQLLGPLKQQISEFKTKVEDVYVKEGEGRSALAAQVRQLMDLNQTLGEDARNLTKALKGSSKTQGIYGELVLERLLEASGLKKGTEYVVQESLTRQDGTRALPDVVIYLPGERNLILDAKVSLNAYEEYSTGEDKEVCAAALKRHLDSVKTHIRGLSERNYQSLYQLKSLDCVLMFVPIEPAFMLAVTSDRELFMEAWNRNVLLVSPSTLLFVVRTVAYLWRQEAQNRNAQEIAKRGGDLCDKLVAFVEDLSQVGVRIAQAQREYDQAFSKLTAGRGNLIRQAENLKALGVKPTKGLPVALVGMSTDAIETSESDEVDFALTANQGLDGGGLDERLSDQR